jgi:regulator of protease activity HflC (stomatin/prohibitin superfamily)
VPVSRFPSFSDAPAVQVVNEGTHLLVPWLQRAIIYDVRTKPRNISTTTGSKDLQMVSLTLRVLHRPDVQALPKIYQASLLTYPATTTAATKPANTPLHGRRIWAKTTMSVCSPQSAMKY